MMKTRQNRNEQTLRLLIVDGVTHTRRNLASFLQLQENIDVVGETAVATDAIHLTQELKPDAIILDINLPDMDGFNAARQLRALDSTLTIILLTVHSRDQDVRQAKGARAIALIEKSTGVDPILSILSSISIDELKAHNNTIFRLNKGDEK